MTWQNPQQQWQPMYQQQMTTATPHSRFGIASFIISLVSLVLLFVLIAAAGVMASQAGGELDETSPQAIMLGLGIIASLALAVLGAVLAIVGLTTTNVKKVFAILGLIFNGLLVLGVIGLLILGTMA
ncbi:MAG TPA: DUF6142 family protein [Tepidisphaeraceae bacterium]|jgi:hypothetical protein